MNRTTFVVSSLVIAVTACSSEETTDPKRPTSDSGADTGTSAPVDSGTKPVIDAGGGTDSATAADTGASAACTAYCQCMETTCMAKAPANCLSACQAQTSWDVPCRTQHCGLAKGSDTALHCGHAAGESTCM